MKKTIEEAAEETLDAYIILIHNAQVRERKDIFAIGRALIGMKELLPDDESFAACCAEHLDYSRMTAYRYMRATQVWGKHPETITDLFSRAAIYMLSRVDTPKDAIDKAILHAKRGRKLTKRTAREIIESSRPKAARPEVASPSVARESTCNTVLQQPAADKPAVADNAPTPPPAKSAKRSTKGTPAKGKKGVPFDPDTAERTQIDDPKEGPVTEEDNAYGDPCDGGLQESEERAVVRAPLIELPDDMTEAYEQFKLSILRHRLNGWHEVSPHDVIAVLVQLKQITVAPLEQTA